LVRIRFGSTLGISFPFLILFDPYGPVQGKESRESARLQCLAGYGSCEERQGKHGDVGVDKRPRPSRRPSCNGLGQVRRSWLSGLRGGWVGLGSRLCWVRLLG
jgi:hypothetical protein